MRRFSRAGLPSSSAGALSDVSNGSAQSFGKVGSSSDSYGKRITFSPSSVEKLVRKNTEKKDLAFVRGTRENESIYNIYIIYK